jgi:amino acid transporter
VTKHLERDLGLYTTITVSIGAMVGVLFIIPGLAAAKGGPSVVLAFLVAGLLVLPAALSKAEMATAMSESGGTYLY